ncbi:MAG: 16S rRNA (cytosine(967)-C(5))-methyltransferase RsmB [Nitrospira sp. SB0667_bin_9]|nr:16S rRNA (cytosine(967)-C(5))-methyltransferase RsmB [Nitrospira sp. SB0667_bin_9]MYD30762.1 16S rRNA (cytosine(967)-C(5))-methyltransferase RsmB [Nitrospira sp. SB0661_bin_20]MYJ23161.1 16S rRNA (cytosine(967)-C(5))-methyltransferase RsmB [Nitrospira sp. SB0673_bin_12]
MCAWTCRSLTLQTLLAVERETCFADEAFARFAARAKLSHEDQALAFELVYGVLRHRATLDWQLNAVASRPVHRLPAVVAAILRLGAYQMRYLDRIPVSAAVNESVKLAKGIKGRDWRGVVNGILRNLDRTEVEWPDVSHNPVNGLSVTYSCPHWLTQRWIDRWGLETTEALCRHTLTIPPLTLRTNTLRCSREQLETRLGEEGYTVSRTSVSPEGLILEKCGSLQALPALQEGWCYVEDEAAQLVPLLLDVRPGQRVLDACAAPGGKCSHIAALMQNNGEIVATDPEPRRLERLESNLRMLGITCVETCDLSHETDRVSPWLHAQEAFDRILVDAPCSGLGVLRRHPEAKWQKTALHLDWHGKRQSGILERVAPYLRTGGILVYSACSTEPEETTQVISRFCQDHPEFCHESTAQWLPPHAHSLTNPDGDFLTSGFRYNMDGFFAARLRRM